LIENEDSKKIARAVFNMLNDLTNIFTMFINHKDNTISDTYIEKETLTLHQNIHINMLVKRIGNIFELNPIAISIQRIEVYRGYKGFEVQLYEDPNTFYYFKIPPASVLDSLLILMNRDAMYLIAEKSRFGAIKRIFDDIYMVAEKIAEAGLVFRKINLRNFSWFNPMLIVPNIGRIVDFISVEPRYDLELHKYLFKANINLKIDDGDEIVYHIPNCENEIYANSLAKILIYFGLLHSS